MYEERWHVSWKQRNDRASFSLFGYWPRCVCTGSLYTQAGQATVHWIHPDLNLIQSKSTPIATHYNLCKTHSHVTNTTSTSSANTTHSCPNTTMIPEHHSIMNDRPGKLLTHSPPQWWRWPAGKNESFYWMLLTHLSLLGQSMQSTVTHCSPTHLTLII